MIETSLIPAHVPNHKKWAHGQLAVQYRVQLLLKGVPLSSLSRWERSPLPVGTLVPLAWVFDPGMIGGSPKNSG